MKEITCKQVQSAIETEKKKLIKKAKESGLYENFGEKEVRKLKEKFEYNSRIFGSQKDKENMKAIDEFDEWCMSCEL